MSHQPNPDSSGEIAWTPYDTVNTPIVNKPTPDWWRELSDVEQQRLREIAMQLDALTSSNPGTALGAIITAVNKSRKVRP